MLARILPNAKTWLLDDPEGTNDLTDLDELELQLPIRKAERLKNDRREQLDSLRDRYRSAMDKAGRVEGHELAIVRAELTTVLKRTAVARSKLLEAMHTEVFLNQLALAKRSDTSIEGFDIDPHTLPAVIDKPVDKGLPRHFGTPPVEFDPPSEPETLDEWGSHELSDVESCVDDMVAAAGGDDPVPTLAELFETDEDEEFDEFVHGRNDDISEAPEPEGTSVETDANDDESGKTGENATAAATD